MLLDVVCPEGVPGGGLISVQHPSTAASFEVAVPANVAPGETFQVEIPEEAEEPPSLITVAVLSNRLTPENADALRGIMLKLYDFTALDDWLDEHAEAFADYDKDAEQRLEWTTLHNEYVGMVEGAIGDHLATLGASTQDLYGLLADVADGDERADKFLRRLLGMGNYDHFCTDMRDEGGDGLKVCGYDVRALVGKEEGYTACRVMVAPI
tara:strand:- start:271 stop:900 length:630 start_codon:yes stop_codon:yes gene_type:complete